VTILIQVQRKSSQAARAMTNSALTDLKKNQDGGEGGGSGIRGGG